LVVAVTPAFGICEAIPDYKFIEAGNNFPASFFAFTEKCISKLPMLYRSEAEFAHAISGAILWRCQRSFQPLTQIKPFQV
jgi:hypothetical protein